MPTTVRFVSEALAATSLKERSAVVVGSKASLSAAGVYDLCRYVARALQHGERAVALRGEPAGTDLDVRARSLFPCVYSCAQLQGAGCQRSVLDASVLSTEHAPSKRFSYGAGGRFRPRAR